MSTEHTMARVEGGDLTLIYAADDPTASACLISAGAALQVDSPDDLVMLALNYTRATMKHSAAPEPAPIAAFEPRHPEPAGFQREQVIGFVAGDPVTGITGWDSVSGAEGRYQVSCELAGLELATDGDSLFIGPTLSIPLDTLGQLIELHQMGALDQLVTLARRWCNDG